MLLWRRRGTRDYGGGGGVREVAMVEEEGRTSAIVEEEGHARAMVEEDRRARWLWWRRRGARGLWLWWRGIWCERGATTVRRKTKGRRRSRGEQSVQEKVSGGDLKKRGYNGDCGAAIAVAAH